MGKRICVAFGTRPEATKMAPVVHALQKQGGLEPLLLVTGQHREQLDQVLDLFDLTPDADLDVMRSRQTLPELTARIVPAAAQKLRELEADYVLVHGDTLTTFAVALAAFFEQFRLPTSRRGCARLTYSSPSPKRRTAA